MVEQTGVEPNHFGATEGLSNRSKLLSNNGVGGKSVEFFGMVDLTGVESNHLFEVLQDWNSQLAQFDLDDRWCDNDNFTP